MVTIAKVSQRVETSPLPPLFSKEQGKMGEVGKEYSYPTLQVSSLRPL